MTTSRGYIFRPGLPLVIDRGSKAGQEVAELYSKKDKGFRYTLMGLLAWGSWREADWREHPM